VVALGAEEDHEDDRRLAPFPAARPGLNLHGHGGPAGLPQGAIAAHLVANRQPPTSTGRRKRIASMETVATRTPARSAARLPQARSICDSVQPPKTLPPALASAGMAMARSCGRLGCWEAGPASSTSPHPAAACRGLATR